MESGSDSEGVKDTDVVVASEVASEVKDTDEVVDLEVDMVADSEEKEIGTEEEASEGDTADSVEVVTEAAALKDKQNIVDQMDVQDEYKENIVQVAFETNINIKFLYI